MEPIATLASLLDKQENSALDELAIIAFHEGTPSVAFAAEQGRLALERFKLRVRKHSCLLDGDHSYDELYVQPQRRDQCDSVLQGYVYPAFFHLGELLAHSNTNGMPGVRALLTAPWPSQIMLTAYAQYALVMKKVEFLRTKAEGRRSFNWVVRTPTSIDVLVYIDDTLGGVHWKAPVVSTLKGALEAIQGLFAAIDAALARQPVEDKLLRTPTFLEGDEAFERYKLLLQYAFKEDSSGGAVGYYRRRQSTCLVDLDGPDDERLYSPDSFDTILVDGDSPHGRWSFAYHPHSRRGLFSPASSN